MNPNLMLCVRIVRATSSYTSRIPVLALKPGAPVKPLKLVAVALFTDRPLEPTLTPGAVQPGIIPRVVSVASGLDVEIAGLNKSDRLYPNRRVFTIAALKTWFSSNV